MRSNLWQKISLLVIGMTLLSGCSLNNGTASVSVDTLSSPTIVAHRGGANKFPESSVEAFKAVSDTNFPLEMDLRSLDDGTLVPQHDPTVDRNMLGLTGPVGSVTLEKWRLAKIKGVNGQTAGTPTTWEEILDNFGGTTILVPEIKESSIDLDRFIASIVDRGLERSVIVQSFDLEICKQLAASGLHVLYLFGKEQPSPHEIKSFGIDFVGPAKSVEADYLRSLQDAELKVWPWTVNESAAVQKLIDGGADGVFTDDPWLISQEIEPNTAR